MSIDGNQILDLTLCKTQAGDNGFIAVVVVVVWVGGVRGANKLLAHGNFSHHQAIQSQQVGGEKFKQHHPPTQRSRRLQGVQL